MGDSGAASGEVERVSGGAITADESMARWIEGIELLHIALTQPGVPSSAPPKKGWSVFRNVGSDDEHHVALERSIQIGRERGFAFSAANFMIEGFVFIGRTEAEARKNQAHTNTNFGGFLRNVSGDGRFTLPPWVQNRTADVPPGPPPDAVVVETFSWPELELFANAVMPQLRTAPAAVSS